MRLNIRIALCAAAMVGACGGGSDSGTSPDATLRIEARSVATQTGLTGSVVGVPPSVRLERGGVGAAGIVVTFTIVSGDGVLTGPSPATDANGIATVGSWKLGRNGVNTLSATAAGATGSPVTFEAIASSVATPRARYTFADSVNVSTSSASQWVPAGIRGDGRARDGKPVTGDVGGEYQGDFCGANALIGRGDAFEENNSLIIDPRRSWDATLPASCQPQRVYRVYLGGAANPASEMGPLSIVDGVNLMAVGEGKTTLMVFQAGAAGGAFRFIEDAALGTSAVLVTRLPDVRDELDRPVRQWRVESRGTHRAADLANIAKRYYLPFVMTVTEVPYPFPTYP